MPCCGKTYRVVPIVQDTAKKTARQLDAVERALSDEYRTTARIAKAVQRDQAFADCQPSIVQVIRDRLRENPERFELKAGTGGRGKPGLWRNT